MAKQINDVREGAAARRAPSTRGALFAMGLIDELSHAMVAKYREGGGSGGAARMRSSGF